MVPIEGKKLRFCKKKKERWLRFIVKWFFILLPKINKDDFDIFFNLLFEHRNNKWFFLGVLYLIWVTFGLLFIPFFFLIIYLGLIFLFENILNVFNSNLEFKS